MQRTYLINKFIQFSLLFLTCYILIRFWQVAVGLFLMSLIGLFVGAFIIYRWYKKNVLDPIEQMKKIVEEPLEQFNQNKQSYNKSDPKVIVVDAETIKD